MVFCPGEILREWIGWQENNGYLSESRRTPIRRVDGSGGGDMKWILFRVVLAGILVGEGRSAAAGERLHHVQGSVRVIYYVSGESAAPTLAGRVRGN